jgi:hypothetical protein
MPLITSAVNSVVNVVPKLLSKDPKAALTGLGIGGTVGTFIDAGKGLIKNPPSLPGMLNATKIPEWINSASSWVGSVTGSNKDHAKSSPIQPIQTTTAGGVREGGNKRQTTNHIFDQSQQTAIKNQYDNMTNSHLPEINKIDNSKNGSEVLGPSKEQYSAFLHPVVRALANKMIEANPKWNLSYAESENRQGELMFGAPNHKIKVVHINPDGTWKQYDLPGYLA